ncbi:MAG: RNA polymerase sigma factor [Terriglobales bacterium]
MLRFQAGEDACFDELVARFRRPLLGFVYRMVHDAAAAEELLQEAFLRVYLHRERYRPQAHFSTWMYRIVHRLALNYVRDHRHDQPAPARADGRADGEARLLRELVDVRPNMEQAMLAASEAECRRLRVQQAITALPVHQRSAVILNKYQGLDYDDISRVLQLSVSATKSLLFRAYATLRRELRDLL